MTKITFLTLVILAVGCSTEKQYSFGTFNPMNIEAQTFKIKTDRDTILTTKAGTILQISANTFLNASVPEVEFLVQEVMSKADLIKSGIPTIGENGELLESGGMLKIQTNPRLEINPQAPVIAKLPVASPVLSMKKYTADLDNGEVKWSNPVPLLENPAAANLKAGEQLFKQNCAMCHSENLSTNLTGPALACLEQGENKRERAWLLRFTRNSQKMIAEKDPLAVCNWIAWRPVVMTSFDSLTDLQINQIYDYIKEESIKRNLCEAGNDFGRVGNEGRKCMLQTYGDTTPVEGNAKLLVIDMDSFEAQASVSALNMLEMPTDETYQGDTTVRIYYYTIPITNYNWVNCDNPVGGEFVNPFYVKAESKLEVFLIFKNRKALWPLINWKGRYILFESEGMDKVRLPVGEPATLLAFGPAKNGNRTFCEIETKVQATNNYELKTKEITEEEFQKAMEKW